MYNLQFLICNYQSEMMKPEAGEIL